MTTTLIIARHGNTFEDGEIPRRVGRRTDLKLTAAGEEQARAIGRYLKESKLLPAVTWCGTLQRTRETARLALSEAGCAIAPEADTMLDEIDYGPDENCSEAEVVARIGDEALTAWEDKAIVPPGWLADPKQIAAGWLTLGKRVVRAYDGRVALAVTSNGIARFAPHLTGDFETFRTRHKLKLATGALGVLVNGGGSWAVREWNVRPAT